MKRLRHRWLLAYGSIASRVKWGCSITIRCSRCERRRFAEEIVVNCGVCDRCFDASWEAYMREVGQA